MTPRPALVVSALLVAALFGGARLLRRDVREPNLEVRPADMVRSPAAGSQGLTSAFADGLVVRPAPPGTVARDAAEAVYGPGPAEAARAGEGLGNPTPDTRETRVRGERVFQDVCATCHGVSGLGDGAVTKRGVPPPPPLLRPESKALADGEMFHAITFGRKNMPAHALQVEREDRWKVIRYVRSLQEPVK